MIAYKQRRIRREYVLTEKAGISDIFPVGTAANTWSSALALIEPEVEGLPFMLERFIVYTTNAGGIDAGFAAGTVVTLHLTTLNPDGVEEEIKNLPGSATCTTHATNKFCLSLKDMVFTRPVYVYFSASTISTANVQAKFDYVVRRIQVN